MYVVVRKLHVAILARSPWEMSQTGPFDCLSFLSRVCISVRCSNFFKGEKHPKTIAKNESPRERSVEWTSDLPKRGGNCGHGWSPVTRWNGDNLNGDNCGHSGDILSQKGEKQQVKTATTRVYTYTAWKIWFRNYYIAPAFVVWNDYYSVCVMFFEIYDNNNWPTLIMIRINIIILNFKHITHSDDFILNECQASISNNHFQ